MDLWGRLFVMFWNVSEQILNTNNIRWKAHNQAFYNVYNSCIIIAKYKESNLKKKTFWIY